MDYQATNCSYTSSSFPIIPSSVRSTLIFETTDFQEMVTSLEIYSSSPQFSHGIPATSLTVLKKQSCVNYKFTTHPFLSTHQSIPFQMSLLPCRKNHCIPSTDRLLHPPIKTTIFSLPSVNFFVALFLFSITLFPFSVKLT